MPDGLRDVLREKGAALFSGRIDVDTGGLPGVVHMSEGQVLDARLGTTTGEPALWRMLLTQRAKVSTEAGKPRATSGAVLGKPDALLERYDERVIVLTRYAEKVGGFERVWAVRFDALAAILNELPDAINPVLRLLDGRRSVRHVVTECALDDMLALRILAKLLAHGILVLPDDMSAQVVDVTDEDLEDEEGLEAALAASLAEIEAEDEMAASVIEPVLLERPRLALSASEPPGAMPAPSGMPDVSASSDARPSSDANPSPRVPPASAALPSAPRPVKNDELRSWLGSEDAPYTGPRSPSIAETAATTTTGIGVVPMVLLFTIAVGLGALIASSC